MSTSLPRPRLDEMSIDDLRQLAHTQHLLIGKAIGELDRVSGRLGAAEQHFIEQAEAEGLEGDTARAWRLGGLTGLALSTSQKAGSMAAAIRKQLAFEIDLTSPKQEAASHG